MTVVFMEYLRSEKILINFSMLFLFCILTVSAVFNFCKQKQMKQDLYSKFEGNFSSQNETKMIHTYK